MTNINTTAIALPHNPTTGKLYSAKNTETLLCAGFEDPRWAGFRQWSNSGRKIVKGSKATKIIKVITVKGKDGAPKKGKDGKPATRIRSISLFNFSQTEAMPETVNA